MFRFRYWEAANTGVGAWIEVGFAATYTINFARIMQRDSGGMFEDLELLFSDQSTQQVHNGLYKWPRVG